MISIFKNIPVAFILTVILLSCSSSINRTKELQQGKPKDSVAVNSIYSKTATLLDKANEIHSIKTGADNYEVYLPLLKAKNIGIVANQSSIVLLEQSPITIESKKKQIHLVDFLLDQKIKVQKIFAPEHGFRGTADAGEHVVDGMDSQTGLPIISLYGNNKKPKTEQLAGLDVLVFDLQDVGARFYTYISSLHYIMEACAENNIELIILDRPNPNGSIVDGPILEKEYSSFVGMHTIPVLHGMTIGEYAKMINGEKWLKDGISCTLSVIPCSYYNRNMKYNLPVKPSPNLPNEQAINLYASLCFFEGTNVSVGRGTEKQFQIYGSPYLPKSAFSFVPKPNMGAQNPVYNGVECYGEDLSSQTEVGQLELKWIIKAYKITSDRSKFFNPFFTKLAGTIQLQQQIEAELSETDIRQSWQNGLAQFKKMRAKYLIY
ncbi:exo-beta-N-acetylmuramidase NamZ domain-containing protein [Flavobacterium sp. ACAM 123]|jgi:uncharacterized protein YbbC (DUF1343 family)|uniref:exo-beta-N-acetylmuramidase NamZ family protein n=1 Tax=Flavobacterium sp. ACAM 123 TaxID=1189620 RepID=UPI000315A8F1|nr:DUF1343 domain-containing protein [Flavobacterium sp. ACAM 123]